jgi:XTP/dITP diphosphohydrolase
MTSVDSRRRILLATANPGKEREFRALFDPELTVLALNDLGLSSPDETGMTIADNAVLKAVTTSLHSELVVVADDSGLEVDALRGAPGVFSARYAGVPPDDQQNIDLLLSQIEHVPEAARTARFRCVVVVARGGAALFSSEGICEGTIGREPRGTNGFGYDPIFVLPDGRTMAELPSEEKNVISHRALAFRAVAERLNRLIDELDIAGER